MSKIISRPGPRFPQRARPVMAENHAEIYLTALIGAWGVEDVQRQVAIAPGLRADIVYRLGGITHIVELKVKPATPQDVAQLRRYIEAWEANRHGVVVGILAAPSLRADVDLAGTFIIFVTLPVPD